MLDIYPVCPTASRPRYCDLVALPSDCQFGSGWRYAASMRWRWVFPVCSFFAILSPAALAESPPAKTELLDGIVAVVDATPVLLSELRSRAKPTLLKLDASGLTKGPERSAAEAQVYRDILSRMVDELLFSAAAERAKLVVTVEEIDTAIQALAAAQGQTSPKVLAAANAAGFTDKEFREEVRRQVLETKVVRRWILPRIKGRDARDDALPDSAIDRRLEEARARWLDEQRAAHFIEVRL